MKQAADSTNGEEPGNWSRAADSRFCRCEQAAPLCLLWVAQFPWPACGLISWPLGGELNDRAQDSRGLPGQFCELSPSRRNQSLPRLSYHTLVVAKRLCFCVREAKCSRYLNKKWWVKLASADSASCSWVSRVCVRLYVSVSKRGP